MSIPLFPLVGGCCPQADGTPLLFLPQADVVVVVVATLLSYLSGRTLGSKLVS